MRALKLVLKSLTVILLVAACAPASQPPSGQMDSGEPTPTEGPRGSAEPDRIVVTPNQAAKLAAETELVCQGPCPSAIAMAVARTRLANKIEVASCTSFLVSNDVVATNAHCLPDDLQVAGASCAGRMSFYFGSPAEIGECDRVVSVSGKVSAKGKAKPHADYAFLHLTKRMNREPFTLSRKGIADDQALTAYLIDPSDLKDHHIGTLHLQSCAAKQRSLVTPQFTNDFANLFTAACTVIHGNSGSPLVAEDGTVRGMIQGFRSSASYKGFKKPDAFVDLAFGTNIACVDSPALKDAPAAECAAASVSGDQYVRDLMKSAPEVDVTAPFVAWRATAISQVFQFSLTRTQNARQISIANFDCVHDVDGWISKPAAEVGLDSLKVEGSKVTVEFKLPLWGLQPTLDTFERVSTPIGVVDRGLTTLTFDRELMKKNGFARVTKNVLSESHVLKPSSDTYDLSVCK